MHFWANFAICLRKSSIHLMMLSKPQNKGDVLEDGVGAALYRMYWTCPRGSYLFDYHHRNFYQGRKWSWQVGIHKIIAYRSHVVPQREFYWLQNGYVLVLCICWSCRRLLLGRLFFICKLLFPFLEDSCDYEWFLVSLNSSLVDRWLGDGETTQSDYFNRRVLDHSLILMPCGDLVLRRVYWPHKNPYG